MSTDIKKISKEINNADNEYLNMSLPRYRSFYATAGHSWAYNLWKIVRFHLTAFCNNMQVAGKLQLAIVKPNSCPIKLF